jgi:hypothetical protein
VVIYRGAREQDVGDDDPGTPARECDGEPGRQFPPRRPWRRPAAVRRARGDGRSEPRDGFLQAGRLTLITPGSRPTRARTSEAGAWRSRGKAVDRGSIADRRLIVCDSKSSMESRESGYDRTGSAIVCSRLRAGLFIERARGPCASVRSPCRTELHWSTDSSGRVLKSTAMSTRTRPIPWAPICTPARCGFRHVPTWRASAGRNTILLAANCAANSISTRGDSSRTSTSLRFAAARSRRSRCKSRAVHGMDEGLRAGRTASGRMRNGCVHIELLKG